MKLTEGTKPMTQLVIFSIDEPDFGQRIVNHLSIIGNDLYPPGD